MFLEGCLIFLAVGFVLMPYYSDRAIENWVERNGWFQ